MNKGPGNGNVSQLAFYAALREQARSYSVGASLLAKGVNRLN